MRYLMLIYGEETPMDQVSPAEWEQIMAEYNAFGAEMAQRGVLISGEALQPTSTATTVRVQNGKTLITDGPFAETKEALGGYYLLNCKDLDEALECAAKIPGAKYGSIEVRPVIEFE